MKQVDLPTTRSSCILYDVDESSDCDTVTTADAIDTSFSSSSTASPPTNVVDAVTAVLEAAISTL